MAIKELLVIAKLDASLQELNKKVFEVKAESEDLARKYDSLRKESSKLSACAEELTTNQALLLQRVSRLLKWATCQCEEKSSVFVTRSEDGPVSIHRGCGMPVAIPMDGIE